MEYLIYVLISALSWVAGIVIARWSLKKFFGWVDASEVEHTSSVSSDDIIDWDISERPFIPVKIIKEHGQYYAWFKSNDKFIGQADKLYELRQMAQDNVLKQIGLRLEFDIELKPKKNP
jgi:hypothetical protein